MSDLRFETHRAALAEIGRLTALDQLITRGDRRRLVREARDWYLETRSSNATRNGTCVVVTAGPPGAGKTSTLRSAVEDIEARLLIDADVAKEFLARWCQSEGLYGEALETSLPDGRLVMPLDLSPVLQTVSTEVCNAVRRMAVERGTDLVVEGTMATPAYGERLLLSLGKGDYETLLIVSVEVERTTAHERAQARWWAGRLDDHELGGRLVLPATIDAMYPEKGLTSVSRDQARRLLGVVRAGRSTLTEATLMEYDDGALVAVDARPPRAVGHESFRDRSEVAP